MFADAAADDSWANVARLKKKKSVTRALDFQLPEQIKHDRHE